MLLMAASATLLAAVTLVPSTAFGAGKPAANGHGVKGILATLETNVASIADAIAALKTDVSTLTQTTSAQSATIDSLSQTESNQGAAINTLNQTTATQGTAVNTLNQTVTAQVYAINRLTQTVANQATEIAALQASNSTLTSEVNTLADAVPGTLSTISAFSYTGTESLGNLGKMAIYSGTFQVLNGLNNPIEVYPYQRSALAMTFDGTTVSNEEQITAGDQFDVTLDNAVGEFTVNAYVPLGQDQKSGGDVIVLSGLPDSIPAVTMKLS
jgi:uncharacterized coiled-coil protein SlyX